MTDNAIVIWWAARPDSVNWQHYGWIVSSVPGSGGSPAPLDGLIDVDDVAGQQTGGRR